MLLGAGLRRLTGPDGAVEEFELGEPQEIVTNAEHWFSFFGYASHPTRGLVVPLSIVGDRLVAAYASHTGLPEG